MHRPMNDYTTRKQHIYIKATNTHIYTYTQHKCINTYIMSFYLLAVIVE